MKTIESIYNSEKFGKKELRKIKGGLKLTNTNHATNTPRKVCGSNSVLSAFDADDDTE